MAFTNTILDEYKLKIGSNMYFYTYDEMKNTHKITDALIKKVMTSSCNNAIGDHYINTVASYIKNNNNFDMVCVFNSMLNGTYSKLRSNTEVYKEFITSIAGFIVLQKGECAMYPNTYAVNLLCSTKQQGKILLTLALYTIFKNPSVLDKRCVLELANGYINAPGLCMYSKLGFNYDGALYTDDTKPVKCFTDVNNLPMVIDLSTETEDSILKKLTSSSTREKLCEYRGDYQQWLGYLYNLKYIVANNKPLTISANEEVDYQKLHDYIINNNTTVDELINIIENAKNYDFTQINAYVAPTKHSAPAPAPSSPVIRRSIRFPSRKSIAVPSRQISPDKLQINVKSRSRSRSKERSVTLKNRRRVKN